MGVTVLRVVIVESEVLSVPGHVAAQRCITSLEVWVGLVLKGKDGPGSVGECERRTGERGQKERKMERMRAARERKGERRMNSMREEVNEEYGTRENVWIGKKKRQKRENRTENRIEKKCLGKRKKNISKTNQRKGARKR